VAEIFAAKLAVVDCLFTVVQESSMQRLGWARRALCLVSLCVLSACPGRLKDADSYDADNAYPCDVDAFTTIIGPKCATAGCHTTAGPQGGLSMETTTESISVIGRKATGFGCTDRTLVDPNNAASGYLFQKLTQTMPACGQPMPNGGTRLTPEEITCIRRWFVDQNALINGDTGAMTP
jgi:hypothetical protein